MSAWAGAAGVNLYPFHAKDSSLPPLAEGVWSRLLQAAAARDRPRAPAAAPVQSSRAPPSAGARLRARTSKRAKGRDGVNPARTETQPAGGSADGRAVFLLAEPHFEEVQS